MPVWLAAGLWGLLAGGALVLGAAVAWWVRVPPKVIAGIMAFGAGVLISALAFELVDEAVHLGGATATISGFLAGAVVYVIANALLDRHGARHRKRSGGQQPSEAEQSGSGAAIAIGALLDGVPESVVLGLSLLAGGAVSPAVLAAISERPANDGLGSRRPGRHLAALSPPPIQQRDRRRLRLAMHQPGHRSLIEPPIRRALLISNVPEGLSSAAGMKQAKRRATYVFGVWGGIALASGLAALLGFITLGGASPGLIAVITSIAAGAILAMLADTMIPEAFEKAHVLTGFITALGFLTAFTVHLAGQ